MRTLLATLVAVVVLTGMMVWAQGRTDGRHGLHSATNPAFFPATT